jgi:hypothetical protein
MLQRYLILLLLFFSQPSISQPVLHIDSVMFQSKNITHIFQSSVDEFYFVQDDSYLFKYSPNEGLDSLTFLNDYLSSQISDISRNHDRGLLIGTLGQSLIILKDDTIIKVSESSTIGDTITSIRASFISANNGMFEQISDTVYNTSYNNRNTTLRTNSIELISGTHSSCFSTMDKSNFFTGGTGTYSSRYSWVNGESIHSSELNNVYAEYIPRSANSINFYLATSKGLFFLQRCNGSQEKYFTDTAINDLYYLKSLQNGIKTDKYVFVLREDGLSYGKNLNTYSPDFINLETVDGLNIQDIDVTFCKDKMYLATSTGLYFATIMNIDPILNVYDFTIETYEYCTPEIVQLQVPRNLTSAHYNYQWYRENNPIRDATGLTLLASEYGEYQLQVSSKYCSVSSIYTIAHLNLQESPSELFISGDAFLCNETSTLYANIDDVQYEYFWYNDGEEIIGAKSPQYEVNHPGIFQCALKDCSNTVVSSDYFEVFPTQENEISFIEEEIICNGDTLNIELHNDFITNIEWKQNLRLVSEGSQYIVKNGIIPNIITYQNSHNCYQEIQIDLDHLYHGNQEYQLPEDLSVFIDEEFSIKLPESISSFYWDLQLENMQNPRFVDTRFEGVDTLNLNWKNTYGCSFSDKMIVSILSAPLDIDEKKEFSAYPNPVVSTLYVNSKFKIQSVRIFDLLGNLIEQQRLSKPSFHMNISMGKYQKGAYLLFLDGIEYQSQKVILKE